MSLYNALFGVNSNAGLLLMALGIGEGDVPRFRDCYVDEDGHIVVHTRTGGGNRDYYENEERCKAEYPEYFKGDDKPSGPWNDDLRALPGFLYDRDSDYDYTYADFVFTPPAGLTKLIEHLQKDADETLPPADKWQKLLTDLKNDKDSPEAAKALEVGERIFAQIKKGDSVIEV